MKTLEKPDYEIAAQQIGDKWQELRLTATIRGGHIQEDADKWQHRAYTIAIRSGPADVALLPWRQGLGTKSEPVPCEVLAICCRDFVDADGQSFEDWCDAFGYDSDSRKAEKTWHQCLALGDKIKLLGLSDKTIAELAELASRL